MAEHHLSNQGFPHAKGEMAERIRSFDWASTSLGPIEAWPENLRTAVDLMLASIQPVYIGWGDDLISLYNDGYILIAGAKHPQVLGQPYRVMWSEIWNEIRPVIEGVMAGESVYFEDRPLPLTGRPGHPISWFTTSATPIWDRNGKAAGFYTVAIETTERVLAEASLKKSFEVLFNSIDEGIAVAEMIYDEKGEIVDMIYRQTNRAFELQGGVYDVEDRSIFDVLPGVEQHWLESYKHVARTGEPIRQENYQQDVDRWIDCYFARVDEAGKFIVTIFNDISVRKRQELRLRESEERFQQFARASAAGLWIRDAETLAMEFTSRAVGSIYGVEPDALLGGVEKWAAMIVPEDREVMLRALDSAREGNTSTHEFRIQRSSDGAFRWIRNTDFPLQRNGHVQRIGGIAEDVTESKLAIEHQAILLAELQHRVRNIMAMIRSMANRTAPGAQDKESYRSLLEGRLLALARVQALLTRGGNVGGSLGDILQSEISAQAHHGGQYELIGPEVMLSPKAVEVLTLAFHELATNALKYGALSVPEGRLAASWASFEKKGLPWLALDWQETGAPLLESPKRRGFGSELIEARVAYELRGSGKITVGPEGARCRLEFPLSQAESILETDAPQPRSVFGGTLDMTDAPDLTGRRVLLVEDEYYMAADTAAALRGAGAEVIGPSPSAAATMEILETETPTHAVLDLNLGGGGPRFEIAKILQERGVPFLFLTGYDSDVIPASMSGVLRLQKPLAFREIVDAVSRL